jgi:hypothetical protein
MLARGARCASVTTKLQAVMEELMRSCCLPCAPLATGLLLAMLGGCDSTQYKNASHPTYSDAEYKSDLAQCRKQNSKVVAVSGYDDRSEIQVDETKARSCMTARGWQAVSR